MELDIKKQERGKEKRKKETGLLRKIKTPYDAFPLSAPPCCDHDHDHAMPDDDEKQNMSCVGSGKSSFNQIESSPCP